MSRSLRLALALPLSLGLAVTADAQNRREGNRQTSATGTHGAVSCGSPIAAAAGIQILKDGGNAFDACAATLLVQSVVESGSYCFGGEVPMIVYVADRDVVEVLAGQGGAPRLASAKWFQDNRAGLIRGRGDIANVTVPGGLHAILTLVERYGTKTFEEVAAPVLRVLTTQPAQVAEASTERPAQGQQRGRRGRGGRRRNRDWYPKLAKTIGAMIEAEKQSGGDRIRGIRLARDYFYRGPVARQLDKWSRENDGLLRYVDLATHETRIEEPQSVEFMGYKVVKCGFWTQGPALLQALRLLEGFDLKQLGHNSEEYVHTVTEAMKLAFADRDTYYGDPLFVHVPGEQLLSEEYATMRRAMIKPEAAQIQQPGDPYAGKPYKKVEPSKYKGIPMDDDDTTTCTVADRFGNVISTTPSGWGGVREPETGVILNSRMISLNAWDGHPSVVEPGKRPRITLTPTMVLKAGKPVYTVSVAGGDMQDQCALQILLNHMVFGFDPDQAVSAPRFSTRHLYNLFGHVDPQLGSLSIPESFGEAMLESLGQRGHKVRTSRGTVGAPSIISIDGDTKHAAGDPRARRSAAAY